MTRCGHSPRTRQPECEFKWAWRSITMNKVTGGNGIPVELFQKLKDAAAKVLHSICQQIWKTQRWLQDWKRSVFIPIPKKGNAKGCSNYHTTQLISHGNKVMFKILQATFQQYVNWKLPNVQFGFRKGRGIRDQIASICWIKEKAREFQRNIYFFFTDYTKVFDCVDHKKLWKILREMGISGHHSASWETCIQIKKQELDCTRNDKLVENWERKTVKAEYCHLTYLTYMQSTSWEMLGKINYKLESSLLGEISIISDMDMISP